MSPGCRRSLPLVLPCTLTALLALTACPGPAEPGGTPDAGSAAPIEVPVHVATWNLKQFPAETDSPARFAEAISALDVDVLAVQEVEDPAGFESLLDALPGYEGVLGAPQAGATPIRVGLLWRTAEIRRVESAELFGSNALFPRPALRADFEVVGNGAQFAVINVHLKAGIQSADEQQRIDSAKALVEELVRIEDSGEDEVLLVGDFNEAFGDARAPEFFGAFEGDNGHKVLTRALEKSGAVTFLPAGIVLDHMVASPGFDEELREAEPTVVTAPGSLSDHHPVRLELTFSSRR